MKKTIILLFALGITASLLSCQAIKKVFIKPPAEGVGHESYPVVCHGYKLTMTVKASPGELFDYLARDASWLENSAMKAEFPDLKPGTDLTEIGQVIDFNVRMVGINFSCQMITIKYVEGKELWLLVLGPGVWENHRIEVMPAPEGSLVTFDTIGSFSKTLGMVVDTLNLLEEAGAGIDRICASIQAEFDPSLNTEELLSHGLRGEMYDSIWQAYETSIWINAPPEDVEAWITDPENTALYLQELKMEQYSIDQFQKAPPGKVIYSPGRIDLGAIKTKADFFSVKDKKDKELVMRLYYIYFGNIGILESQTKPEAGGTLVTSKLVFEIPGFASGKGMEIILFATGIPKLMQERVLLIKREVEGVG